MTLAYRKGDLIRLTAPTIQAQAMLLACNKAVERLPLTSRPMNQSDFKSLCAELTEFVARLTKHYYEPAELLTRARAALAEPEPEGPTDEDLLNLHDWMADEWVANHDFELPLNQYARAVLARWGRPTLQPVPVSERLPKPEDCDAEGECYWFDPKGSGAWYKDTYQGNYSHWLPAHALPVPIPKNND